MSTWEVIRERPRTDVAGLRGRDVPAVPGVYVWWRDGEPVYVGEAKTSLRQRLSAHLATGPDLTRSTLRRSVALARLGIPRAVSGRRPSVIAQADADTVSAWLRGCELAWVECESAAAAHALEAALRSEWLPPLNRM